MELNKDLHSKELLKLNRETLDWKWYYLKNENKIFALNPIKQKSYQDFWNFALAGSGIFVVMAIIDSHSSIYMQVIQLLILLTIILIISRRTYNHILDYYTIDRKHLINTNSDTARNIVRLLNMYKQYDKKEEYNNLLQEVVNNKNGIGVNLNNKYKDVDIDALRYKYYLEDKTS